MFYGHTADAGRRQTMSACRLNRKFSQISVFVEFSIVKLETAADNEEFTLKFFSCV